MAPLKKYRVITTRVVRGAYLRRQRERAGMSVRFLARVLDVAPQFLSRIERDQVSCPDRILTGYESLKPRE
jgi:transcriptional regulator with XRE-family HTH domain